MVGIKEGRKEDYVVVVGVGRECKLRESDVEWLWEVWR